MFSIRQLLSAGTRKLIVRGALAVVIYRCCSSTGEVETGGPVDARCVLASLPYSVSPPGQRETSPQRIRVGDS